MKRAYGITLIAALALVLIAGASCLAQDADREWLKVEKDGMVMECQEDTRELAQQLLPEIARRVRNSSRTPEGLEALVKHKDEVLRFIADQLGMDKPSTEMSKVFDSCVSIETSLVKQIREFQRFKIWRKEKLKELLISGTSIPGLTYNPETDMVASKVEWPLPDSLKDLRLPIVLKNDPTRTEFEQAMEIVDDYLRPMPAGVVCHEAAEVGMTLRHNIRGAFRRWFCDGVADHVAVQCLRRFAGQAAIEQFLKGHQVSEDQDLVEQVDLLNWRAAEWQGSGLDDRLADAHYAYSRQEIEGLVGRHGPDVISRILKEISGSKDKERGGRTILHAIKKATGEDFEAALSKYGTKSRDEFKGFAIRDLRLLPYEEDSKGHPKTAENTDRIPLTDDSTHGFVLVFACTSTKLPVYINTQLQVKPSLTFGSDFALNNDTDVAYFPYHFDGNYQAGPHVLKVFVNGRLFKEVKFELVAQST